MKAAIYLVAAFALAACGDSSGGGGGEKPPVNLHEGEVQLQVMNACRETIYQLWYVSCDSLVAGEPVPVDAWVKIDLPYSGEIRDEKIFALGRNGIFFVGWIPVGKYTFLWCTDRSARKNPIPEDLPAPPFSVPAVPNFNGNWTADACHDVFPVMQSSVTSPGKDLWPEDLVCPE
jgi:hypothetical protein